ncbi:McrB family protein [Vibrio cholerae]|uniref:McrB family protein n=1 Tax=Vibrio cholerae TaxID=666 RepID=UPI0020C6273A
MLVKLDEIKLDQPLVNSSKLFDYKLTSGQKGVLQKQLGSIGYGFDTYTSFAITDKESDDKPANYALIPNQYFVFASEMYEFASELFKYFEIYEKIRPYANSLLGDSEEIKNNIRSNQELIKYFSSENDLDLFSKFLDKDDATFRLGSKRLINDYGKPRGSRDCFGSVILKEINLPDASSSVFGRLVYDLCQNPNTYKDVYDAYNLAKTVNVIRCDVIANEIVLPKPFLLLAGISGTGKTRFVRKQAEARGQLSSTYCLTSVRPDWHEPSDLLGYVSRLGGHAEYITTDVLTFMAQAWRAIADNENLNIECVDSDGQGKRLVVSGEAEALEDVPPYWLCLDEMNLAPVEQYFADYLSVLETREWCWDSGDSFRYSCDALLKPSFLQLNGENSVEQAYNTKLRESLKLADSKYDDLWHCFCEYGLPIPFNLIVAGTVNMDETTHGFSRKVIDRAMSFDFGEFFPNEIDEFFEGDQKKSVNTLSYPILSHVRNIEEFSAVEADSDASKTKAFFKAINNVLKNTPFELAFRAFNELCLSVICFTPKTDTELAAVFDDYLMCKVLPRIEGDEDKVRTSQGHNLLEQLTEVFQEQLTTILPNHESISRPDLLRHFEGETAEKVEVEWRSEKKLKAMTAQLNNGFCSFWP